MFLYCEKCGTLNSEVSSEEGIVCDTHLENQAIGFCVVCGRAVCTECAENSGRALLCSDTRHRTLLSDWKVVHTFDFEYEAAMLCANLDQHDIESEVFTKLNPNVVESSARPTKVTVLVPKSKYNEAMEISSSIGLDEEEENEE